MEKYLKANIRLGKIHERGLKSHYAHLDPQQKRLVKNLEIVAQCEKEMWKEESVYKNHGWRTTDVGQLLLERYFKATESAARYCHKLGIDAEEAADLLASTRTNRFYGGNF